MELTTSTDRRVASMNRWIASLTIGGWALVFVVIALRYVNTGRLGGTSVFLALMGVSGLLSLASRVPRRRALRWLLRSAGAAALVGAVYVLFRNVG